MLSKTQISFIRSLQQKKFREQHGCFVAEGTRLVLELAGSRYPLLQVYALRDWVHSHSLSPSIPIEYVSDAEMKRITALSSPSPALAVVKIPEAEPDAGSWEEDLTLVLDEIRDPGNLGTIIRIADWFGIRQIICSHGCVDSYNPKVIQATMGSFARIRVVYTDLPRFLGSLAPATAVYGMTLDGRDLYTTELTPAGLLVIGNEAHGISPETGSHLTHRISIPFYPAGEQDHAESLNAAVAAGIVCGEFRRRRRRDEGRRTRDEGRGTKDEGRRKVGSKTKEVI